MIHSGSYMYKVPTQIPYVPGIIEHDKYKYIFLVEVLF